MAAAAACWTLREISCVAAPCSSTAEAIAVAISEMRPMVLPIYRRKGIIPQVAEGLQNASALLRTERR